MSDNFYLITSYFLELFWTYLPTPTSDVINGRSLRQIKGEHKNCIKGIVIKKISKKVVNFISFSEKLNKKLSLDFLLYVKKVRNSNSVHVFVDGINLFENIFYD